MKEKTKLLGSSSTLEGIVKIIAEYYCCSKEDISKGNEYLKGTTRVFKKGKCMNTRIVEKKNRFRFELIDNSVNQHEKLLTIVKELVSLREEFVNGENRRSGGMMGKISSLMDKAQEVID